MSLKNISGTEKSSCRWIICSGLIIVLLFLIDLLFIKDTILTPYQEFHPCSKPARDERTGITYRVDLKTGKAYALDQKGNLARFDKDKGRLEPLGPKRKNWIALPEGLIYNHPPLSPLYSFFIPAISFKIILPVFLVLLFLFLFEKSRGSSHVQKTWMVLIFLLIFSILIRASFAWVRHGFTEIGTEFLVYENEDVIFDVPKIGNTLDFLRDYPEKMPSLSLHGSHFPPGYVLLMKGIASLGGYSEMTSIKAHIGLFGWFILILGCTAVVPLYLIIRKLFDSGIAFAACVIFILVPNSVIFGAVSMDALFVACALWPVWFLVKAMNHKGGLFNPFMAGILLALCTFLSFSGLALGLFLFLLILSKMSRAREKIWQGVRLTFFTLSGFACVALFLWIAFRFNFLETFLKARELEARLMNNVAAHIHGKSTSRLWLYTTGGNFLAFAIFTGFPVVGIWLRGVCRNISERLSKIKNNGSFSLIAFVFVFIIGVSGIYRMETERIWLFVTAFVVIAAAGELTKVRDFPRKIFYFICAILLLQTALVESLIFTLW